MGSDFYSKFMQDGGVLTAQTEGQTSPVDNKVQQILPQMVQQGSNNQPQVSLTQANVVSQQEIPERPNNTADIEALEAQIRTLDGRKDPKIDLLRGVTTLVIGANQALLKSTNSKAKGLGTLGSFVVGTLGDALIQSSQAEGRVNILSALGHGAAAATGTHFIKASSQAKNSQKMLEAENAISAGLRKYNVVGKEADEIIAEVHKAGYSANNIKHGIDGIEKGHAIRDPIIMRMYKASQVQSVVNKLPKTLSEKVLSRLGGLKNLDEADAISLSKGLNTLRSKGIPQDKAIELLEKYGDVKGNYKDIDKYADNIQGLYGKLGSKSKTGQYIDKHLIDLIHDPGKVLAKADKKAFASKLDKALGQQKLTDKARKNILSKRFPKDPATKALTDKEAIALAQKSRKQLSLAQRGTIAADHAGKTAIAATSGVGATHLPELVQGGLSAAHQIPDVVTHIGGPLLQFLQTIT
jgi:hypothetical protein